MSSSLRGKLTHWNRTRQWARITIRIHWEITCKELPSSMRADPGKKKKKKTVVNLCHFPDGNPPCTYLYVHEHKPLRLLFQAHITHHSTWIFYYTTSFAPKHTNSNIIIILQLSHGAHILETYSISSANSPTVAFISLPTVSLLCSHTHQTILSRGSLSRAVTSVFFCCFFLLVLHHMQPRWIR